MKSRSSSTPALPTLGFERQSLWADWLEANHATSAGLWLRLAKKGSGLASVSYDEAVEVALCHGWIDGQKRAFDDREWVQKFTPRGARSVWSKINRDKVERLIASGQMRPAGLAAVERARAGGQWEKAYDGARSMAVPPDLQSALDANEAAKGFFATLNGANRYAVLFRIQTAVKAATREKRILDLVAMLARKEKLHP